MSAAVYLPPDEFGGARRPNLDLAADYLELKAIFSKEKESFSQDIIDALDFAADSEFPDVDIEIKNREETANGAIGRMASRKRVLNEAYPFDLGERGYVVSFVAKERDLGQAAYTISLLLSNLDSISPLLDGSDMHPSDEDVRALRQWFQYFATAALAAEIGGPAWFFGFPRPGGTGFIGKLTEIWGVLKDGSVEAHASAPENPKDGGVDVFAWREQRDGLPGFLLAAAQVATGKDWKDKSIVSHMDRVFPGRWFERPPVTRMVPYHVIPFARPDNEFPDDVRVLGNVLHRLRVPHRVSEAVGLAQRGILIEAFDRLEEAAGWVASYVQQARG